MSEQEWIDKLLGMGCSGITLYLMMDAPGGLQWCASCSRGSKVQHAPVGPTTASALRELVAFAEGYNEREEEP